MHIRLRVKETALNLILQWIGREKSQVAGIIYLSTKTNQLRNNDIGINFVFPPNTETVAEKGFCSQLNNLFVWSKPISWQLLNTIESNNVNEQNHSIGLTDDLEKEVIKNYKSTKFYSMEEKLRNFTKLKRLDRIA